MTREKAIEILKQRECCRECVADCSCDECENAFDMAIKALEQEPTTKNDLAVDANKLLADCEKMSFDIEIFNKPLKVVALDAVKNIAKDLINSENPNKSEILTGSTPKNDLGVDCISRADALRVAKNEYLRGWHNALCKALSEKYSIHCEEGEFSVIQEETITGLGLSMDCALGKDVESYMSTIPSVTPQKPRKGEWLRMSDLSEQEDDRYKCSRCGNVIHHKNKMDLYTFNSWCGRCGSDNGRHVNYEVEE